MDATISAPLLSNDILFNHLFKLLPAKSLMRFKSVCKSWRDMISDPFLVESRFHSCDLPLPDESHIFFFMKFDEYSTRSIIPSNVEGEFSTKIPTHMFSKNLNPCTEIVNGFICLMDKENFLLYMFNVYTGDKMPLPSIPKPQHENSSSWRELFAMGFDPSTDERKILLLYIDEKSYFQEGKILTFGTNTWRDMKFPSHIPSVREFDEKMICIRGIIYWMGSTRSHPRLHQVIECFNVGLEEFGTVEAPAYGRGNLQLAQIGGNLALWCSEFRSEFPKGTLWRFNENRQVQVRDSRFVICRGDHFGFHEYEFEIIGTTKGDDEILFVGKPTASEHMELVFYDLATGRFRRSKITSPGHPRVVVDLLSLVSAAADIVHVESNPPLKLPIVGEQEIQNQQRQQMGEWPKKNPDVRERVVLTEHDIQDEGIMKKIKKRVSSKDKIPNEIIFDVFTRLPAKSLMRFKCVCKAWLGLICHPYFAECHHFCSQTRLDASHILFWMEKAAIIPTNHEGVFSSQIPTCTFNKCEPLTEIVNGLICLSSDLGKHLCMLNLTTGERRVFPDADFHWPAKIKHGKDYLSIHYSSMLGFDHVAKKYKVLRMIINEKDKILACKILTFGTRKWAEIDSFQQPFESPSLSDNHKKAICANGMIYWMGELCVNGTRIIQCFDLGEEKFRILFPPQDAGDIEKLIRIGGNLALFCKSCEVHSSFNLWRLSSHDDHVWVKNQIRFPWEMSTLNLQVIGSTKRDDNEIIFTRKSKHCEVIIFDMGTQNIRTTTITWPGKPAMVDGFFQFISGAAVTDFVENIFPLRLPSGGTRGKKMIEEAKRSKGHGNCYTAVK